MEATAANSPNGRGKLQGKLLPKSISAKRPWKRNGQSPGPESNGEGTESRDDTPPPPPSRGRSLLSSRESSQATAVADTEGDGPGSHDMADDEEFRSRAAGDSDDEIFPTRPKGVISTHPSQIGYLTTSSPLVQAEHLQDIRTPTLEDSDRSSRASTLPPDYGEHAPLDTTTSLSSSKTGLVPPPSKNRRSVSPGGRFRNVFKSKKSTASVASNGSNGSNTSRSPERQRPDTADKPEQSSSKTSDSPAPSSKTTPFPSVPPPAAVHDSESDASQPDISKVTASDRFRRLSRGQKVDTASRPETPTSNDTATPVIVNTPPTPTDPAHPSSILHSRTTASPDLTVSTATGGSPNASPSSASNSMIAQRRSRAGSASLVPSKLSNFTLAPLTPTPENGPTTPSATGFFSSVLSAAQNATNSLSNTITSTNWGSNSKKAGGKDQDDGAESADNDREHDGGDDEVEVESSLGPSFVASSSTDSKEPAVKTLGMGDLSLSQLGITEQPKANGGSSGTNSAADSAYHSTTAPGASPPLHPQSRVAEVTAESRHRSESAPPDPSQFHAASESFDHGSEAGSTLAGNLVGGRPASVSDTAGHEDRTPPPASIYGDKQPDSIQRTGSIRSAIDRRRKRGSSAATGGTIAAAIAAANASVAHPAAQSSQPKLTGFAVASKKRNRDFHNYFKSVPDDDYLIEDYSCALQREILAHGRLYVSEGHLCFSSNILGWTTTLVMSFDEIVSVEKRSTALVFKNGLMISTLHAKHIFASFASRDSTYDLIVKIWKLGHPSLQSSLNGVRIDETGGDKTEKIEAGHDNDNVSAGSRTASESGEDSDDDSNDVYDEDAEDDDTHDATQASEPGGTADVDTEKAVTRKASGTVPPLTNGAGPDKAAKDAPAAPAGGEFPGPLTHAPTDCGDAASHYDKILADEVIPAPLGKVFSYMFGAQSVTFMPKWLSSDQKCFDIQMTDKKGLGPDNKSHTYSYIKPLNASIGPKQTKCIVTEQIEGIDFEKAINVVCSTQNPDVPSGNIFTVKTKYCLSWGENNGTRVQMNCTTEWAGKSWLKVPIEKAANEGQAQYGRDLFAGLKEALSSRPRSATASNGAAGGKGGAGKKKGRKGKAGVPASGPTSDVESKAKPKSTKSDWGVFEPVHGIVGPAVDLLAPVLTGNVMYGLLVGLLVASWFGFGFNNYSRLPAPRGAYGGGRGIDAGPYYPDRVAAYDEMWRREESELWEWLEERIGLDRLANGGGSSKVADGSAVPQPPRKKVVEPRTVEEKLREERMDDREIREAIRVTEEKLRVLKEVIDKRDTTSAPSKE